MVERLYKRKEGSQCRETFSQILNYNEKKKSATKTNYLNPGCVHKSSCIFYPLLATQDLSLEPNYTSVGNMKRSLINVRTVGKLSSSADIFVCMKRNTAQKSPMNVQNVVKPTGIQVTYTDMQKFILERNPMSVRSVTKPGVHSPHIKDT